jgi:DNA-binding FrmR family transcriptional regulator
MTKLVQPSREATIKRLSRSLGHFQSTIEQLKRGRATVDVAQQLHAVAAAINAAKVDLVREQMQHTLSESEIDNGVVRRLQVLARYL